MHVLIRLNVSLVIRLYFICKHAGIRDHTDESKQSEQSVFRISFYLCKFSRLHILHSHRLKQSVAAHFFDYRIPQKCDLRIGKCFLLNRLCCTQLVSSVNDRNFSGKFCKIQRFFHRCIPAARYIDFQVSKEVRITGCTVRDSASLVLLLAFASDRSCICTGCNDDIFRLIGIFFACQDFDVSAQFCICDRITDMFCAELFCLFVHSAYKRNSRLSFYDLSRIVFYFVCVDNLAAGLSFFNDQGVQSAPACI